MRLLAVGIVCMCYFVSPLSSCNSNGRSFIHVKVIKTKDLVTEFILCVYFLIILLDHCYIDIGVQRGMLDFNYCIYFI